MNQDEQYMQRCIQLARNGQQNAAPNPMVGAVIVARGRIIGEGYHVRCGEGHAEVNAFASVRPADEPLLKEATIYVSLEPCSHYGKTPPCADLIVRKGVRRVVVGTEDPFAEVQGRGIERLRQAGIEVTVGVLREECEELNKVFFTFHRKKRPFITLKWAESKDGFIAGIGEDGKPRTTQISNALTRMHSHKLRAEHQAILIGRNTLDTDRPSLTTRYWTGRNPVPIVLSHEGLRVKGEGLKVKGELMDVMHELHARGIQSVLVEGGANVLQQFIDQNLWDEAYIEQGEMVIGEGVKAPQLDTKNYPLLGVWGIKEQKKHIKNIKSLPYTSL